MRTYRKIIENKEKGLKQLAVLLDPDKVSDRQAEKMARLANECKVDYIFIGGSLLTNGNLSNCIKRVKENCDIPVILFPGNPSQIDGNADALLFLSLISGRNPELLIGNNVSAAPIIREKQIEAISTGYMLIESGNTTTALYMSNTQPVPADKKDIAACTAMAGEMLGMKMIFMDAGSGAQHPVSEEMIAAVRNAITIPLIVGGGIRTPEKAYLNCRAGADMIVIGNLLEKHPELVAEFSEAIHKTSAVHR